MTNGSEIVQKVVEGDASTNGEETEVADGGDQNSESRWTSGNLCHQMCVVGEFYANLFLKPSFN